MYRGTRFRSRLEARWAYLFDAIGWQWEYEPFDVDGYVPDFAILGPRPLLIEVKPALTLDELEAAVLRVGRAQRDALIVGATPTVANNYCTAAHPTAGLLLQWPGDDDGPWGDNRWCDPDYVERGHWMVCLRCKQI